MRKNDSRKNLGALIVACLVLSGVAWADSPVLEGNYLRVGVSNSGGLIDDSFTAGIDYDKTGTSTWTGWDFLKPGTPFEFYSIGVDGTWQPAGYWSGNNFSASTADTSSGSTNSAVTTGSYGDVAFRQTVGYADSAGVIGFQVQLTNTSSTTSHDLVYARGLDPDQDVYAGGGYATTNTIVNGDLVIATAPITDWTIGIFSNSPIAHVPTVDGGWSQDPYALLIPHDDGYGDYTINMAWNIGTLAPGAMANFGFEYRVAQTPEEVILPLPGAVLLGALGLSVAGWRVRRPMV